MEHISTTLHTHSAANRRLYRTFLVENVGFLETLSAALVTTYRKHLAFFATLAETADTANT